MKRMIKQTLMVAAVVISATLFVGGPVSAQENAAANPEFNFKNIDVSREGAVLVLRLNTPPRNEVSKTTLGEIDAGLDMAARDESVGAIVITGSESVFSAGAGGDSLQEIQVGEVTHAFIAHAVFNRIEGFPKPVIAAVSGISTNGGNELALSCDIRIAGESARFGQQELHVGLIPGFGGMQRLQRFVGLSRAMDMMLTARLIDAQEALSFGLVSSVVPDADVVPEAIALGRQLAENLDKHAFAAFKERMAVSYNEPFAVALRNDQLAFDRLAASDEAKAAIARFVKKMQEKQQ